MTDLEQDLTSILNRHCAENDSNTPDFILAEFLLGVLACWNAGVTNREAWYNRNLVPGQLTSEPVIEVDTNDRSQQHPDHPTL